MAPAPRPRGQNSGPLWISNKKYTGKLPWWIPTGGLALLVFMVSTVAWDYTHTQQSLQPAQLAQDLAAEQNAALPRILSAQIVLKTITADAAELVFTHHYRIPVLSGRETAGQLDEWREKIRAAACSNSGYQDILAQGLTARMVFFDPSSKASFAVPISKATCTLD